MGEEPKLINVSSQSTQDSTHEKSIPRIGPKEIEIRQYLNRGIRVQIQDGRIFIGKFLCTDKFKNIILGECAEFKRIKTYNNIDYSTKDSFIESFKKS